MTAGVDEAGGPTLPGLLPPWVATAYMMVASAVVALYVAGLWGDAAYVVMAAAGTVAFLVGVHLNRPPHRWPWLAVTATGVLWTLAGAAREATDATGDLSPDRSLLPDLFAFPAYLCLMAGLIGFLRQQGRMVDRAAFLDGAIVAAGTFLVSWRLVVVPMLERHEAWVWARIAIVVYPVLSAVLVSLACRLAFASARTSLSHRLLLVAMGAVFVGDVVFSMVDARVLDLDRALAIYLIASVALPAAALHPSMHDIVTVSSGPTTLTATRVALLAGALVVPAVLGVTTASEHAAVSDQVVQAVAAGVLGALVVGRLVLAVRHQAALHHRATHDELTGLPNRRGLFDALSGGGADRSDAPVALLLVDLDDFKLVNDTFGHAAGDQLLVAVAARLTRALRPGDVVARFGGDEFAVVCRRCTDPESVASRVLGVFSVPFTVADGEVSVTPSIGIAHGGDHRRTEDLLRDADAAMYAAKAAGRNTFCTFRPDAGG